MDHVKVVQVLASYQHDGSQRFVSSTKFVFEKLLRLDINGNSNEDILQANDDC